MKMKAWMRRSLETVSNFLLSVCLSLLVLREPVPTCSNAEIAYKAEQVLSETLTLLIRDPSLMLFWSCGREKYV